MEMRRCVCVCVGGGGWRARREQGGGGHRRRTEESNQEKKKKKRWQSSENDLFPLNQITRQYNIITMIVMIMTLWAEGTHVVSNLRACSVPPDYKAFKQNTSPRNGALQVSRDTEPDIVWAVIDAALPVLSLRRLAFKARTFGDAFLYFTTQKGQNKDPFAAQTSGTIRAL